MRNRYPGGVRTAEITPRHTYAGRREFMAQSLAAIGAVGAGIFATGRQAFAGQRLQGIVRKANAQKETATSLKEITTYNNFYEFGTDKEDPANNAHTLRTRPWTVAVEGAVRKPKIFDVDELLKLAPLEERVYRLRCVEGWSMVIPWVGYSLGELIRRVEPTGNAKFVEFITLSDITQMPQMKFVSLDWPYLEGLRMDEALHPLTLLCLGLYGEVLPNQNGAPVRLVVPWKYGFKSGKSLVKIRFVEKQPITTWMQAAPDEYGFYSNVNPQVDHPRWSQAKERRIGELGKRPTQLFNGYGAEVASLYAGMDLKKHF